MSYSNRFRQFFGRNFHQFVRGQKFYSLGIGSAAVGSGYLLVLNGAFVKPTKLDNSGNSKNPNIKYFTKDQIKSYKSLETGIYVTRGKNVYDVTSFIEQHPGGSKILLAAGKSVDPFWNHYRQHQNPHVEKILEEYKIGELSDYDPNEFIAVSPYLNDPDRVGDLHFHSQEPCNCEAAHELVDEEENPLGPIEYITDNAIFFIRNHHPVPDRGTTNYNVNICGKNFTYDNLFNQKTSKFSQYEITTTIQCGGNRRKEYNQTTHGKTSGTAWLGRAISTAKWQGVWLRDVILKLHPDICENEKLKQGKWVTIKSIDSLEISIPIEKILDPNGDVMLAYQMNGQEIPRDHGYPVRLIVPGFAGIRNVKWVSEIRITDEEVESTWQTGIAYKMLPHYSKKATAKELSTLKTTLESPVTSFMTSKPDIIKEELKKNDEIFVYGYAWSGGGRGIQRVEFSSNNEKSWKTAELIQGNDQNPYKAWAWTLWRAPVSKDDIFTDPKTGKKMIKMCCKAVDMGYNSQPRSIENIWNLRGINNNSWHFLEVEMD